MGELKRIWIKRSKRGPMDSALSAKLVTQKGIVGNSNQGGYRQVTIIEEEAWALLMDQMNGNLDPSTRRANLMISGLSLKNSRKKVLMVGHCEILICGETKPCERMDEALMGLREAMYPEWKGGAYGRILVGGEIKPGDEVAWKE